ncbi:hypothetical protein Tco_0399814 [Tanacetum coccineum]
MAWEDFKTLMREEVAPMEPTTIQKAVQIAGTLTDEAIRNGSIKKNLEKRENRGEPRKDRNGRDDNKRTRTGNAFATTSNPVRRENTGTAPKVVPKNVNPVNARHPAAARGACFEYVAIDGGQGRGNNGNQACGRGFMLGAEEARQDPNIMTGMDWLSNDNAKIICHEKVVRIPLLDGKVLRVLGERPEKKVRHLMSAKAKEQKQEKMVMVRDFPKVFPDDLSGVPQSRNLPIDWHLLKWRSFRVNSKKSRTRVSFDQAYRLGEHRYCLLRKRTDHLGCVLIIES